MGKSGKIGFMQSNIKLSNRTHGGKNALNLLNNDKIKDFSVSINPYGPPPETKLSIDFAHAKEYPDPESKELKKLIASLNNVNEENIFIGNGSAEIIALFFFCFVRKKDSVLSLYPSFGDYYHYTSKIYSNKT